MPGRGGISAGRDASPIQAGIDREAASVQAGACAGDRGVVPLSAPTDGRAGHVYFLASTSRNLATNCLGSCDVTCSINWPLRSSSE